MARYKGWTLPKYKTAAKLQAKVDEYFVKEDKPTISGMALFLGYLDRQSIYDLLKLNDDRSCIIRQAVAKIESFFERKMTESGNVSGPMFWLKCHSNAKNIGKHWCDRQDIDITTDGEKINPMQVIVNSNEIKNALNKAVEDADANNQGI